MNTDVKIRVGMLAISLAVSAIAALMATHGLYTGILDGLGSGPP